VIVADELLGFFSAGKALRAGVGFREFRALAINASRMATGSLTRHDVRTVFRRREAEGVLPTGEAAALYDELTADIAAAHIVIQPETAGYQAARGNAADGSFQSL
jgi:hypothetical protein